MFQKKKVLVIVAVLVVIVACVSGAYLWHNHKKPAHLANLSLTTSSDAADADGSATNSGGATQLNVNGSDNMGQLGLSLNQTTNGGQNAGATTGGSATSSGGNSSNAASEAEQMMNPTTFSQYNAPKYLNSQTAFYVDLQQGTGTEIAAGHMVAMIYKGWLTNGQLFDESKAGANGQMQPFMFEYGANPSQVINGWTEALAGMKVGGVRLLIVPPAAGYGAAGQGPIPGNSVLVFAVQLEAVQ